MSQAPLVTVVIPAYNGAYYLPETLDAALAQTYPHLDVVVVDDGSTDETAAVAEAYAARDGRVRLLRQVNGGVAAARNLALAHARGTFIAPLDADDLWAPTKIARQVARFEAGSAHMGMVYTWWAAIDEVGRAIGTADRHALEGYVYPPLVCVNFVGNSSVPMFRRTALEAAGGFVSYRERGGQGCEDWDIALRIAERFEVGVVPAYLTGYRSAAGSMSRNLAAMNRSFELVMADSATRHPEMPASLLRWTRSRLCSYLANLAYADGRLAESVRLSLQAVALDPLALTSPPIARILSFGLGRWAAGPVLRRLWPDHDAWRRFRGRTPPPGAPLPLDALEGLAADAPSWMWRGGWRLYDHVCQRRWARALHLAETPPPMWRGAPDLAPS